MRSLLKCRGQALLETTFVMPLIFGSMGGLLVLMHLGASQLLVDHWSYEAAICLSKQYPKTVCFKELRQNLKLLPFSKVNSLKGRQSLYQVTLRGDFELGFQSSCQVRKTLKLPLREHP